MNPARCVAADTTKVLSRRKSAVYRKVSEVKTNWDWKHPYSFLPNTSFNKAVDCAAGSVRICFSS